GRDLCRADVQPAQLRKRSEMLDAGVGQLGTGQVELREVFQSSQRLESGIGDARIFAQLQLREFGEAGQVVEAGVGKLIAGQIQLDEVRHPSQRLDACIRQLRFVQVKRVNLLKRFRAFAALRV